MSVDPHGLVVRTVKVEFAMESMILCRVTPGRLGLLNYGGGAGRLDYSQRSLPVTFHGTTVGGVPPHMTCQFQVWDCHRDLQLLHWCRGCQPAKGLFNRTPKCQSISRACIDSPPGAATLLVPAEHPEAARSVTGRLQPWGQ